MANKTIGIVGTRTRDSGKAFLKVFNEFLSHYVAKDIICSGLCPEGADRFAVIIADILRIPNNQRLWFPADWGYYGKSAGFIRNTDIAKNSDILIACVSKNREGGTEDTIKKFIKFHGKQDLSII